METYTNLNGQECVIIKNEDGSTWSGLKSAYEEMLAAQEKQSGTL